MILGGRVAESLTFNKVTTGAQNDLEKATKIAYAKVREFGMSKTVGLISFSEQDIKQQGKKPFSKALSSLIDTEAKKVLVAAYKRTEDLLKENNEKLKLVRQKKDVFLTGL